GPFLPPIPSCFLRKRHRVFPKQQMGFGLIPPAITFKPGNDVKTQPHIYGFLHWPIELPHFASPPIENRRCVGKINVFISFCGDGADVSLLRPCELPHKPSFRATRLREPK